MTLGKWLNLSESHFPQVKNWEWMSHPVSWDGLWGLNVMMSISPVSDPHRQHPHASCSSTSSRYTNAFEPLANSIYCRQKICFPLKYYVGLSWCLQTQTHFLETFNPVNGCTYSILHWQWLREYPLISYLFFYKQCWSSLAFLTHSLT